MSEWSAGLLSYLASAWLHTLVALLAVLLAERSGVLRRWSSREAAWRLALVLPLCSAALPLLPNIDYPYWQSGAALASPSQSAANAPVLIVAPPEIRQATEPTNHAASGHAEPLTPANPALTLPKTLLAIFALTWSLQLFIRGANLLWQWLALRWRSRTMAPVKDPGLRAMALTLAQTAGVANPTLVRDRRAASPSVTGHGYLLLPDWVATLPAPQQRALLAHEIAHLRRRDARWRLLLAARDCLLPIPYGNQVRRQLRDLAELQCDAWAAAQVNGRAVAESLANCARQPYPLATPGLAAAMAESDSALVKRVRHLLQENSMSHLPLSIGARLAIGGVIAASLLALPTLELRAASVTEVDADPSPASSVHVESDDGYTYRSSWDLDTPFGKRFSMTLKREDYELEVKAKGEFEIAADERGLSRVGKSLLISEQVGALMQEVEYRNERGQIQLEYSRNGQQQAVDAQAQAWISAMFATILRESAIDVAPRVARIYARSGMTAVLAEIEQIHSDFARAEYLQVSFSNYSLSDSELSRALELAAQTESDYELRRVLVAAATSSHTSSNNLAKVLHTGSSVESDYEGRLLAQAAVPKVASSGQSLDAWFVLANGLESDYEKRLALTSLADRRDLPRPLLDRLIAAMATLDSDYEARVALATLVPRAQSENLVSSYAQATTQIASDYERGQALKALLTDVQLDSAGTRAVLNAIDGIGSDYEKSSVMVSLAEHMPGESALIDRFRQVASGLDDHERAKAERALERRVL